VLALEWAYVPAVELLMHAYVIALPFLNPQRSADRGRVLAILVIRGSAFAALAVVAPRALLLYGIAYLIMITVLRFADAFQHTYDAYAILESEQVPLTSCATRPTNRPTPIPTSPACAGLAQPVAAQLSVPQRPPREAHRAVVPAAGAASRTVWRRPAQAIPMAKLLLPFHRHRVTRVLADDYGEVDPRADHATGFVGAVSVSFLTAV